jgi:pimeloyl-ACP methyl ester carboxylesterase
MHRVRFPGARLLLCAILLVLAGAGKTSAQSSANDDIHISAIAEFYALHTYPSLKGHKALAVGPGGYWAASPGKPSADIAGKAALKSCTTALRTSSYKSLARRDCVLFDVDGKRTGAAQPTGIPFGTRAEGPDIPYEKGGQWEATGTPRRGNLLLLHGCNKVEGINGWVRAWINFYRASGFRVIMPDNFAEPRDREVCGHPGEDGIDAQTRNLKLRVAQTLRTLATLHRKYPGEPIYVHGHSEGGYVAQALGEKVAGIIVTGAPCGFGSAPAYWVGEGTPLLVIAGTKDAYFTTARSAKALTSYCKTVRGAGNLKTASVQGMGHFTGLWWPDVRESVGKFLKVEVVAVTRRKADGVARPKIPAAVLSQYQKEPKPKALAVHEKGALSWYSTVDARMASAETTLDVEEIALFACDEGAGFDAFQDPSHQHACVLADVNGKRPAK